MKLKQQDERHEAMTTVNEKKFLGVVKHSWMRRWKWPNQSIRDGLYSWETLDGQFSMFLVA